MAHVARQLLSIALALGLALGLGPSPTAAQRVGDVSFLVTASWLAQLGDDPNIVVVDMRPPESYAGGHIPGAISLPWQALALQSSEESELGTWQERTTALLGSLGISSGHMVVSYDESGGTFAARMRWVLKYLGHANAVVLDGGLGAWTALGQPLATEPSAPPATTYAGTPSPERLASSQYILERLGSSDVQILDVRTRNDYTGENPGNFRRSGHIPTALHLDWNNNIQAEGPRAFKSLAEMQALYDSVGLDRGKEIIVYCNAGVWSAGTLFVLEMLGYPRVRLYSASWGEWGNRDDLPVATGPEPGFPATRAQ